tara:strand:- start:657 stop:884 length:228 start_codon:yes stop_codon:yes gene_type:complete
MSKVFFLLLFLSSSHMPQYYNKGMYFLTLEECEQFKKQQVEIMTAEADLAGFKDIYIDARCIEMDIKEFKPSLGT